MISFQQFRDRLAGIMSDRIPLVCSSNGNAGGSTFVASQFTNTSAGGDDYYRGMYAVVESGTHAGKYRPIASFTGSTSTFTLSGSALGSTIVSGVRIKLHRYSPEMYKQAANDTNRVAYPDLYAGVLDDSTTSDADTWAYDMPIGITPDMVRQVSIEGFGSQEGVPADTREDVTYSPDGATFWIGRLTSRITPLPTGQTIYLFAEKYLTPFTLDTDYGTITDDTDQVLELQENTNAWALYLLYAKASMYNVIAAEPGADRDFNMKMAGLALQEAKRQANTLRMPRLEAARTY